MMSVSDRDARAGNMRVPIVIWAMVGVKETATLPLILVAAFATEAAETSANISIPDTVLWTVLLLI